MKTQLCDPTGVQPYSLSDEVKAYPSDRFLICRCSSLNPLGILGSNATPERLQETISKPEYYDRVTQRWVTVLDIVSYIKAIKADHEIRYVKYLDNAADRLMVFCFMKSHNTY